MSLYDISIAGRRLRFPQGTFSKGCSIDSGASFSVIEQRAYTIILRVICTGGPPNYSHCLILVPKISIASNWSQNIHFDLFWSQPQTRLLFAVSVSVSVSMYHSHEGQSGHCTLRLLLSQSKVVMNCLFTSISTTTM
ncbi:unnamed protein product, partial [Ilex paraguariensis]